MKNENSSKRFLIIVIIILAVMNLTTFVTIGWYFYRTERIPGRAYGNRSDNAAAFSNRYFMDRLGMDPGQMREFGNFNMTFRQGAREINQGLMRYREEMLQEMESGSPDTLRLNTLSDSIGMLHSQLKRYTYKYYLDLRKTISPEQESELNNMFREQFLNENPMSGNGRGQMMPGMGRGMRGRSGGQQNN